MALPWGDLAQGTDRYWYRQRAESLAGYAEGCLLRDERGIRQSPKETTS